MRRHLASSIIAAFPWLTAAGMVWYAWSRNSVEAPPGSMLIAHDPGILDKSAFVLVVYWVGAVIFLLSNLLPHKRPRRANVYSAFMIAAIPIGMFIGSISYYMSGPWSDLASLHMPDGKTYHVQYQGVLQAMTYVLSEEVEGTGLWLRTRVIGRTNGDSPRSWASVVLPEEAVIRNSNRPRRRGFWDRQWITFAVGEGNHRLLCTGDGKMLVAVTPWDTYLGTPALIAANMVYDLRSGSFWGNGFFDSSLDVSEVSPFILIGPRGSINPRDVGAICAYVEAERYVVDASGMPRLAVLVAEAGNPNEEVRIATAQMLGHYWQQGDQAEKVLAAMLERDSRPKVQQTAEVSLRLLRALVRNHRIDIEKMKSSDR